MSNKDCALPECLNAARERGSYCSDKCANKARGRRYDRKRRSPNSGTTPVPTTPAVKTPEELQLGELRGALKRAQTARDRAVAKSEDLVAAVYQAAKDAMVALGPVPVPQVPFKLTVADHKHDETALIHTTDWQLGKLTESYNMAICEARVKLMARKIGMLTEIQRTAHPVSRCHIMFGGDIVENCVTPDTKLLTWDLRWVPARELTQGDSLLAFDEEGYGRDGITARQWVRSEVVSAKIDTKAAMLLTLDDGQEIMCTPEHRWLAARGAKDAFNWYRTDTLKEGDFLPKYMEPWKTDSCYGAGWLSGMFDGEGSLGTHTQTATIQPSIGQNEGPVSERLRRTFDQLGIGFKETPNQDCITFWLTGSFADKVKVLGSIRPTRLLQKFQSLIADKGQTGFNKTTVRRVVKVERIPDRPMSILSTTSKTYIAEGFAAHNCDIFPGQAYEIEETLFSQMFRAVRIGVSLVEDMLAIYETVEVTGEPGNHGRLGRRGQFPAGDNADRMVYKIISQHFENNPRVIWHGDSGGWHQIVEVGNYRAMLIHGDEIKSFGGNTPAFGLLRKGTAWASGVVDGGFDDVYFGHFHTRMTLTLPNGKSMYGTGSTESDNAYAAEFVAARGAPSQRLHFIDPRKGRVTAEYTIYLGDDEEKQKLLLPNENAPAEQYER